MEDHDHEPESGLEQGFRSFMRLPLYAFGIPLTVSGGGLFLNGREVEGEIMGLTGFLMVSVGLWLGRKK